MTYKDLIFGAVSDKFEEENINRVFFNYDLKTGENKLYAENDTEQHMNLILSKNEISTIRMLFINKLVKQLKKDYPEKEPLNIIVEIDIKTKELNIFIEFFKGLNFDNEIINLTRDENNNRNNN